MYGDMDGWYVQKLWSQKDGQNETAPKSNGPVQPLPKPAPPPSGNAKSNIDDGAFVVPNSGGVLTGHDND
jgi:hypothetical protein